MSQGWWTEPRVEQLLQLHKDGLSASLIAEKIQADSRYAVIGKLHRLGMSGPRQQPSRPTIKRPRPPYKARVQHVPNRPTPMRTTVVAKPAPKPKPAKPLSVPLVASLLDLPNTGACKWPYGGEKYAFCGREQFNSLPYCEHHARIAYQPLSERRRVR